MHGNTKIKKEFALHVIFVRRHCNLLCVRVRHVLNSLVFFRYRFYGDDSVFDNGTKYPERRCFCAKSQLFGTTGIANSVEECVPSGVRSVSKCRFGAPAFISFPHFYKADPSYLMNIKGLNPNPDLHELYVIVEPVSFMI